MRSTDAHAKTTRAVGLLDALIGARPSTLEKIYRDGRPARPSDLGDTPCTRLLAVAPSTSIFLATRALVRAYAEARALRVDKRFDPSGRSGQDIILGRVWYRFRVEQATSEIDGGPTLLLSYANPHDQNHWPIPMMYDELRAVGDGIALGPTLIRGTHRPLFWFVMTRARCTPLAPRGEQR